MYKLRFKVAKPDSPTLSMSDEIVCIEFEPALLDENLRWLLRSRINFEPALRDYLESGNVKAETIPINFWSPAPMDVCKGKSNAEVGVVPAGEYRQDEWIPDHIICTAATMDKLIEALLDDDARLWGDLKYPPVEGEDGLSDD